MVITATGVWRGPKSMGLKAIVDDALKLVEKGGHKVHLLMMGLHKDMLHFAKLPGGQPGSRSSM